MEEQQLFLPNLPVEMLHDLLLSLDHPNSLANAILSCRILYSIFRIDERRIIQQVLINHIGLQVLPEAALAYTCLPHYLRRREVLPTDLSDEQHEVLANLALNFVTTFRRPVPTSLDFDLNDALSLAKTHVYVTAFKDMFIERCSTTTEVKLLKSFELLPPSPAEEDRIARTLYRFEMFSKVCGYMIPPLWSWCQTNGWKKDSPSSQTSRWFAGFDLMFTLQPWENAQLGCIHDFLGREAILVSNRVMNDTSNPRDYTSENDYDDDLSSDGVQHILSLGLRNIYDAIIAKTSDEARRALYIRGEAPQAIEADFLSTALTDLNDWNNIDWPEGIKQYLQMKPFYEDEDGGPKEIWNNWRPSDTMIFSYEDVDEPHRAWGYTLWDSARLRSLGVMDARPPEPDDVDSDSTEDEEWNLRWYRDEDEDAKENWDLMCFK